MKEKSILIFIVCVMVAIALTVMFDKDAYPYAKETSQDSYPLNKWYRITLENDKWLFIGNSDVIMYFCVKDDIVAFGLKFKGDNILSRKPPMIKSNHCCWKSIDHIFSKEIGILFSNKQEWTWAIGQNKKAETPILKDVLENNGIKIQYLLDNGVTKETQFMYQSSEVVEYFKWLLDDPNLEIKYTN